MILDTASLSSRRIAQWSCCAALMALIVGLSLPRFALFEHGSGDMLATHLALDMFSAVVATLVVVISWHTFRQEDHALARLLIFTFTVVAGMDLIHAISYAGMPDLITPSSTAKAIFFWFMGRGVELLGVWMVLTKLTLPGGRWHWQVAGLLCTALLLFIGTRHLDMLPAFFVAGQGVTPLKTAIGGLITLGNWIAAAHFWRSAARGDKPQRNHYFAASCFLVGTGEVCFSTYVAANDFLVIFGHLFKVGAYILIYLGIFRDGVSPIGCWSVPSVRCATSNWS